MILTAQQVKEKLGIGDTRLKNLQKDGILKPVNKPKEGAKKFFARFDSKDVNRVAAELKGTFRQRPVRQVDTPSDSPSTGFLSRLERLENKVDAILKILS